METARFIIERTDDKNPADNVGVTPLHLAAEAEGDQVEVVEMILGKVEDKNPPDESGATPLHKAATSGNVRICRLIVQHVEDKHPRNNLGLTPVEVARVAHDAYERDRVWRDFRIDRETLKQIEALFA